MLFTDYQDPPSSYPKSYVNYLNFILHLLKSLCGYSCVVDKYELNIKCQHMIPVIFTAMTFSIFPTTSWLLARYGYEDAFTTFCYVMPIVTHNFCLAVQYVGKNVLGFKMKW